MSLNILKPARPNALPSNAPACPLGTHAEMAPREDSVHGVFRSRSVSLYICVMKNTAV